MINNSIKFTELQNKYQNFIYRNFSYTLKDNSLAIKYNFYVDDEFEFHPSLEFENNTFFHFEKMQKSVLESLIFNIGMVELISYWKAMVPKNIIIEPYQLSSKQIQFWRKLYFNGLGEYFYLNGISTHQDSFVEIKSKGEAQLKPTSLDLEESLIIPVGGGKDSVVTLELLKGYSEDNLALIMNPRPASQSTALIGNLGKAYLQINRKLDAKLLELNKMGFLNGHTPFSALLAFISCLASVSSSRKYVALSNEDSANEVTIPGTNVNHQYSKSLEFENDFRSYVHENISPSIEYFSFLRPLTELQIAYIFSKQDQHFQDFRSCNVGSKENIWCCNCSKCLFTFIILYPFLDDDTLLKIYGENLLEKESLAQYFEELTGIADEKPFECIGTVEEVNLALAYGASKRTHFPLLIEKYKNKLELDLDKLPKQDSILQHFVSNHNLKPNFLKILKQNFIL